MDVDVYVVPGDPALSSAIVMNEGGGGQNNSNFDGIDDL